MLRSIGTYYYNCEIHGHTVRGSNIWIDPAKIYVDIVLLFNYRFRLYKALAGMLSLWLVCAWQLYLSCDISSQ